MGLRPPERRAVVGWVLYDVASLIFTINILSLYFPLWVVEDAGGRDSHVGLANGLSVAVILLLAPLLGVLADHVPRRVPVLLATTLISAALTAGLGHGGLMLSLVLFALANIAFGCGLIFDDALLSVVSTPQTRGRISGYGIGAGFGGALIGIATGLIILGVDETAKPLLFKVTAALFLLGALPLFFWLREPPRRPAARVNFAVVRADLRATLDRVRAYDGMGRFLIGRIFYNDAANTIFAFMGIYAVKEVGFSETEAQLVLLVGILAGPIGAIWAGRAADHAGAKVTLDRLLWLWTAVLAAVALIPALGLPSWLFWLVTPWGGVAFGGTATVDRTLLVHLAPPRYLGQFFGLFAMTGRLSAVAGPLLWAATVDGLRLGRPVAVATLAVFVLISLAILARLSAGPRQWTTDDLHVVT